MPYQKKEKNSLLLYYDYKEQFDELTDKQLRELIYAMIEYDQNDNEIELDSITRMAFIPIKRRLKKDKEYYTGKCNTNRENALKRWEAKNATAYDRKQTHAKYADKDKEKDKEKDKDIITKENIKRKVFTKPTTAEIEKYCEERNNGINAEAFYDFYESKDWYVGKNKMRDWKACVRTWEQRNPKAVTKNEPEWFNKEIQPQIASEEERRKIDEMLKDFREEK